MRFCSSGDSGSSDGSNANESGKPRPNRSDPQYSPQHEEMYWVSRAKRSFTPPNVGISVPPRDNETRMKDFRNRFEIYSGGHRPPWFPNDPLFDPSITRGISMGELFRMKFLYTKMKSKGGLASASHDLVRDKDYVQNDLPVSEIPKVPAEILRKFREDVPPSKAKVPESWDIDVRELNHAPLDQHTWSRVDQLSGAVTRQNTNTRQGFMDYNPIQSLENERANRKRAKYERKLRMCPLTDNETRKLIDFDCRMVNVWSRFLSESGKIVPGKVSKTRKKAQKKLSRTINCARTLGLASKISFPFGLVKVGGQK